MRNQYKNFDKIALILPPRPPRGRADEQEANHLQYLDIKKLPEVVGGAALHPAETATTVRVQDGRRWSPTVRSRTRLQEEDTISVARMSFTKQ